MNQSLWADLKAGKLNCGFEVARADPTIAGRAIAWNGELLWGEGRWGELTWTATLLIPAGRLRSAGKPIGVDLRLCDPQGEMTAAIWTHRYLDGLLLTSNNYSAMGKPDESIRNHITMLMLESFMAALPPTRFYSPGEATYGLEPLAGENPIVPWGELLVVFDREYMSAPSSPKHAYINVSRDFEVLYHETDGWSSEGEREGLKALLKPDPLEAELAILSLESFLGEAFSQWQVFEGESTLWTRRA